MAEFVFNLKLKYCLHCLCFNVVYVKKVYFFFYKLSTFQKIPHLIHHFKFITRVVKLKMLQQIIFDYDSS